MSSGLQVETKNLEAIQCQNQRREGQRSSNTGPGVDSERSQRVPAGGKISKEEASKRKKKNTQIEMHGTSAPDSEKSGPLLVIGRMIRTLIREKTWTRRAHAKRERCRAARQQQVGYQSSWFPTGSPLGHQKDVSTVDNGERLTEAGTQPPTEDWAPPEGMSQGTGWTIEQVKVGQNGLASPKSLPIRPEESEDCREVRSKNQRRAKMKALISQKLWILRKERHAD
jgi:hypothetical protein